MRYRSDFKSQVVALDASDIVHDAREIITTNGLDDVVRVVRGKAEEVRPAAALVAWIWTKHNYPTSNACNFLSPPRPPHRSTFATRWAPPTGVPTSSYQSGWATHFFMVSDRQLFVLRAYCACARSVPLPFARTGFPSRDVRPLRMHALVRTRRARRVLTARGPYAALTRVHLCGSIQRCRIVDVARRVVVQRLRLRHVRHATPHLRRTSC